jgi:lysophospholipase L1-like esterase
MTAWTERGALLTLWPMLLAQGAWVRAVTPRLPEPKGARRGRVGRGPALRILVAGDSAAAGVGVDRQDDALSGQLAAALAPRFAVSWRLVARSGYTTRDLLARLRREPAHPFDVAVLSLGVNDVLRGVGVDAWQEQLGRLAALLNGRFGVRRAIFSALPPMHEMRALPHPLRWLLGARARRFDAALEALVEGLPGCERLAPVAAPPHPDNWAVDGFHPGPLAYRAWAAAVAERVGEVERGLTG